MDEISTTSPVTRCKMMLIERHELHWNSESRRLVFSAQSDNKTEEDLKFEKYTPSGRFEMICNNPAVLAKLKLGQSYYVDFTECQAPGDATGK